jgi:hypothetical protein
MTRVSTNAKDFWRGAATAGFASGFFAMREVCAGSLPASISVRQRLRFSWGVHPIAHGRDFGFIHPVMKSRRISQIEMGQPPPFQKFIP